MPSPASFSTKFAQQRHWPLGIFVALLGVIVKKCGPKIVLYFCISAESVPAARTDLSSTGTQISGNADSASVAGTQISELAGTLSLAASISGTLLCLLGLFIIARGVIKLHTTDAADDSEK